MIAGQFLRFGLVGVVNTGTYYLSYPVLLRWMPYLAAHVVAFALSIVGSYFLNVYVSYRTRPAWRTFLLFPLTTVANFTITTGGVYVLVDLAGMNDKVSPLIAAAAAVPITFLVPRLPDNHGRPGGQRHPDAGKGGAALPAAPVSGAPGGRRPKPRGLPGGNGGEARGVTPAAPRGRPSVGGGVVGGRDRKSVV